jgi:hypothetical protein
MDASNMQLLIVKGAHGALTLKELIDRIENGEEKP